VRSAQTTWWECWRRAAECLDPLSSAIDEHRISLGCTRERPLRWDKPGEAVRRRAQLTFARALALTFGGRGVWAERLDFAAQHSGGVFRFVGRGEAVKRRAPPSTARAPQTLASQ
jgi:hypothetical protein